jgi:cellulose synthase/poly-beta-1,6-N-acetylglucosamine synthase-like glycosyltransferase
MTKIIFWVSVALIVYNYAIYPGLLFAAASVVQTWRDLQYALGRRQRRARLQTTPHVSIIIPAHNEERVIEEKLKNVGSLDYPREKLEVIVVSDGSEDRTDEIVGKAGAGVRLLVQPTRMGKPAAVNRGIAEATGEIVVVTDANTLFDPAAIQHLVRHFADERVGIVLGDLKCVSPEGYQSEGLYWNFERALKFLENRIGAVLGGQGGIYAIRRSVYRPIPNETWVDDFVIGMQVKEAGYWVMYDSEAIAIEETAGSVESEFIRKARIGAGNFQALSYTWRLLNPLRGPVAFAFWSHKVLRWIGPFCMIAAFLANVFLLGSLFYQIIFGLQVAFYGAGILGYLLRKKAGAVKALALPYYFLFMNAALAVGFFRFLTHRQRATWERAQR